MNGRPARAVELSRVVAVLDVVRREARLGSARVVSRGDFPAAAGLASSAAGFAALAVAARAAAGLPASAREASLLARLGSGSACRSVQGGVCVWRRGEAVDGSDSFAEQLFPPGHWPDLRLVVAEVDAAEKETSSRDGMRRTVETSPFYPAWVADAERAVPMAVEAVRRRDLEAVGVLAEQNAWRMHATALGAVPPLCYLVPATLALVQSLPAERQRGLPVWFTLDAGPNPVLLTDAAHEQAVAALATCLGGKRVILCHPGGDAHLSAEHLF